ncbi:unnamed protein product, partial [marine sediment metagenome]
LNVDVVFNPDLNLRKIGTPYEGRFWVKRLVRSFNLKSSTEVFGTIAAIPARPSVPGI